MAYDPFGALLAPYRSALEGDEMDRKDPIYSLLFPTGTPFQSGQQAPVPEGDIQQYARRMAREMFGKGHWDELNQLVSHESSWNPQADNPTSTAYGLFQFLDSTRENYGLGMDASPYEQIDAGLKYIKNRYGSPTGAWDFWQANNYY